MPVGRPWRPLGRVADREGMDTVTDRHTSTAASPRSSRSSASSRRRSRSSRPAARPASTVAGLRLRRGAARAGAAPGRRRRRPDRPAVAHGRGGRSTSPSSGSPSVTPRPIAAARRGRREPAADRRPPPARPRATHVEEADSAEAAGRRARWRPRPDVVLLDLNLPGDTGWDLAARPGARGRRPAARGRSRAPPRSARSGSPSSSVAGYLPKPFPLETLVATVERLTHPEEPQKQP